MPLISVIIPTCHRNDLLANCLERLAMGIQKLPVHDYEIIVTDDSSGPTAEEMVRKQFSWARWAAGPRRGPAANRNSGAGYSRGDWLVFCDDDCFPEPGLLAAYSEACEKNPQCDIFEGKTLADRERRHPLEESPVNSQGGNLWSCNFAIRKTTFEELGGFDEGFPYAAAEDMEFRIRAQKRGLQMVFVPAALMIHPWRQLTVRGYLRQQWKHRQSHLYLMKLYPEYRSYFSTWNVVKDVIRYYVRNFLGDIKAFGASALCYQPLFLWCQLNRIVSYNWGHFRPRAQ